MKRKGFTLIELLAVIVILAIIALIATPLILNNVKKTRIASFERSVEGALKAAEISEIVDYDGEFPEKGLSIKNINLKKGSLKSGKIVKTLTNYQAINVTDGYFCATGEAGNLAITENCDPNEIEYFPPIVQLIKSKGTTNSIEVSAIATSEESEIEEFFFKINDEEYFSNGLNSVYNFTNLTTGEYTIYVKVVDKIGLFTEKSIKLTTTPLNIPTYNVSPIGWSNSKNVTINFSAEEGLIYEYKKNDEDWIVIDNSPLVLTFNETGNVTARVSDGINVISASTLNVTQIDNVAPTITLNPSVEKLFVGQDYDEKGAIAIDNIEGDISSRIVITGTVDTTKAGTYKIYYDVEDSVGNKATRRTRTITVIAGYSFAYNGSYHMVELEPGKYTFKVWGAQGQNGGNGGYAKADLELTEKKLFYVYVGAVNGYNGGGAKYSTGTGGNGGGATDVRLVSGAWNNSNSLNSRIIVAGGGSGGSNGGYKAAGGGLSGERPTCLHYNGRDVLYGVEANQTSGNALGKGCDANNHNVSGGGGGYYGGNCFPSPGTCGTNTKPASGGGSGFINGMSTTLPGYSQYTFTNTTLQTGINTGNGKVEITLAQ